MYDISGLPDIPGAPVVKERGKGNAVELEWGLGNNSDSDILLYVIQGKWNIGKHHSEHHMTEWENMALVCSQRVHFHMWNLVQFFN